MLIKNRFIEMCSISVVSLLTVPKNKTNNRKKVRRETNVRTTLVSVVKSYTLMNNYNKDTLVDYILKESRIHFPTGGSTPGIS